LLRLIKRCTQKEYKIIIVSVIIRKEYRGNEERIITIQREGIECSSIKPTTGDQIEVER